VISPRCCKDQPRNRDCEDLGLAANGCSVSAGLLPPGGNRGPILGHWGSGAFGPAERVFSPTAVAAAGFSCQKGQVADDHLGEVGKYPSPAPGSSPR
jgi:hypothetical protein